MAVFTTEALVRAKFQLLDEEQVSETLVSVAIEDAHTELLRFLGEAVDTDTPDDGLVLGETLLAGAHLFRSLASKEAFDQKHLGLGSQRIEGGKRFSALSVAARMAEEQAWYTLEPYTAEKAQGVRASATDTTAVLGESD